MLNHSPFILIEAKSMVAQAHTLHCYSFSIQKCILFLHFLCALLNPLLITNHSQCRYWGIIPVAFSYIYKFMSEREDEIWNVCVKALRATILK